MTKTEPPDASYASLRPNLLHAARYYLGGRRGLLVLAGAVLVAGLALNWGWLVAAGIAPLLFTALPCVAMCALGLCMNRMAGRSCSTDVAPQEPRSAAESLSAAQAPGVGSDHRAAGAEVLAERAMAIEPKLTEERRTSDRNPTNSLVVAAARVASLANASAFHAGDSESSKAQEGQMMDRK